MGEADVKDRVGEVWWMSETVFLILETAIADSYRAHHRMFDLLRGVEVPYWTYEGKVDEWDINPYKQRIV